VPISIGTGFTVMDKSNINDPAISKYVYSDWFLSQSQKVAH
jgi:ribose transport system substrate-binding protein